MLSYYTQGYNCILHTFWYGICGVVSFTYLPFTLTSRLYRDISPYTSSVLSSDWLILCSLVKNFTSAKNFSEPRIYFKRNLYEFRFDMK